MPLRLRSTNKFAAIRETRDGYTFASRKEARRYDELVMLAKAGEVVALMVHPVYPLIVDGHDVGRYTADFSYTTKDGEILVEDVKGGRATRTEAYQLRKRLFAACHFPLQVSEV